MRVSLCRPTVREVYTYQRVQSMREPPLNASECRTRSKILGAMFWILRRTRFSNAASLFNNINNNNSSGKFISLFIHLALDQNIARVGI